MARPADRRQQQFPPSLGPAAHGRRGRPADAGGHGRGPVGDPGGQLCRPGGQSPPSGRPQPQLRPTGGRGRKAAGARTAAPESGEGLPDHGHAAKPAGHPGQGAGHNRLRLRLHPARDVRRGRSQAAALRGDAHRVQYRGGHEDQRRGARGAAGRASRRLRRDHLRRPAGPDGPEPEMVGRVAPGPERRGDRGAARRRPGATGRVGEKHR